jgi:hypothetical protein
MNAHNNENDPFEDVFRDRFADFESEPDTQLWQKIEPKLPVNPTRKFPYWQISAGIILLLLVGLWTYREKYSEDVAIDSDVIRTKNLNSLLSVSPQTTKIPTHELSVKTTGTHSQTTTVDELSVKTQTTTRGSNEQVQINPSSDYRLTEVQPIKGEDKDLTVNDLTKNTTNNVNLKSKEKTYIEKPLLKESFVGIETMAENKTQKTSLFSNPNTTIERANTSLEKGSNLMAKEKNNFSNNNNNTLNLFSVNNSNEKQENQSNNLSVSSVFSNKENVSVLNKNYLTSLDSKSYSLLRNHFKTPKLKFVIAPKKDDYFKERKPLEIYASVMPLLNYYTITPNGNDANYVHSIAVNNDDDRLGFYTQAGAIFTLSDRFKLRTGLTYTKTNHSINYQIRTDSLIIQPSDKQGVDVSFEEKKATYSQVANYLGTKIEVQYIFLEGESLTHYVNVGLDRID